MGDLDAGASGARWRSISSSTRGHSEAGLQVRAGLGYGPVLAIGGDYFGNPSTWPPAWSGPRRRADPGSTDVRDELPDWPAIPRNP